MAGRLRVVNALLRISRRSFVNDGRIDQIVRRAS